VIRGSSSTIEKDFMGNAWGVAVDALTVASETSST
jgi:hypothetical protein